MDKRPPRRGPGTRHDQLERATSGNPQSVIAGQRRQPDWNHGVPALCRRRIPRNGKHSSAELSGGKRALWNRAGVIGIIQKTSPESKPQGEPVGSVHESRGSAEQSPKTGSAPDHEQNKEHRGFPRQINKEGGAPGKKDDRMRFIAGRTDGCGVSSHAILYILERRDTCGFRLQPGGTEPASGS